MLAPWLLTAVVKIVTTYTIPGQRVLLNAPADLTDPTGPRHTGMPRPADPGPYSGLTEAAWTVLRLGRGVQTHLTAPTYSPADDLAPESVQTHLPSPNTRSESGPGLGPLDPHPVSESVGTPPGPIPAGRAEPDTGPGERYHLIITAADPGTLGWLRPAEWISNLTSTGTLAVITHRYLQRGRVTDPAAALVPAADHVGLRLLDRVVVLTQPAPVSAATAPTPDQPVSETGGDLTAVGGHNPVDLFLFTHITDAESSAQGQRDLR